MNHCSCDKLSRLKMYGHCRTRRIASTVIQEVLCYWFWEERENLWAYQSMLLLTASARGEGKNPLASAYVTARSADPWSCRDAVDGK